MNHLWGLVDRLSGPDLIKVGWCIALTTVVVGGIVCAAGYDLEIGKNGLSLHKHCNVYEVGQLNLSCSEKTA